MVFLDLLPSPEDLDVYREPALGGGSMFWRAFHRAKRAVLSDTNAELIGMYRVVQRRPAALLLALAQLQKDFDRAVDAQGYDGYRETYLALRALRPAHLDEVARAARMIALNKTGNNGMFRVNRAGGFNVPPGKHLRPDGTISVPRLVVPARLVACSGALGRAELKVCDMVTSLEEARAGELVYVDPPYIPISATANFTAYSAGGFGMGDQQRLAAAVRAAHARGVLVAVSNSDTKIGRKLYKGFDVRTIRAMRSVSSKVTTRGEVSEILVRTWA